MKEEFVSYDIACKLEECGFDWKVNDGYSVKLRLEPEVSYGEPKEVHSKDPKNFNDNRKGADKGIYFYSRPSQSLAQKWLRDVKGIHVEVTFRGDSDYEVYGLVNHRNFPKHVFDLWDYDKGIVFHSYESALSAGIDAALNLLTEKQ